MRTKLPKLALIALLSIGIVFALSWMLTDKRTVTAQTVEINETNLADLIAAIPVQTRIRRVELNHTILSVDLAMPGKARSDDIFADLYFIAQHAIGGTSNLNEVLVRVFDSSWGSPGVSTRASLLLSGDLTRKGIRGLPASNYDKKPNFYRTAMERNFQISYTPRWPERFGGP
jgi:hypothetical protein